MKSYTLMKDHINVVLVTRFSQIAIIDLAMYYHTLNIGNFNAVIVTRFSLITLNRYT